MPEENISMKKCYEISPPSPEKKQNKNVKKKVGADLPNLFFFGTLPETNILFTMALVLS